MEVSPESHRRLPLPIVQTLLPCHEIYTDSRTRTAILAGATSHIPIGRFPAHVRLSFFIEVVGCHGEYTPRLELRDGSGAAVWGSGAIPPLNADNPLMPYQLSIHDMMLAVPGPGRYTLTLTLNGQEASERGMWFGRPESFRGSKS